MPAPEVKRSAGLDPDTVELAVHPTNFFPPVPEQSAGSEGNSNVPTDCVVVEVTPCTDHVIVISGLSGIIPTITS